MFAVGRGDRLVIRKALLPYLRDDVASATDAQLSSPVSGPLPMLAMSFKYVMTVSNTSGVTACLDSVLTMRLYGSRTWFAPWASQIASARMTHLAKSIAVAI